MIVVKNSSATRGLGEREIEKKHIFYQQVKILVT